MKKLLKIILVTTAPIWFFPVNGWLLVLDIYKMIWGDVTRFIDRL